MDFSLPTAPPLDRSRKGGGAATVAVNLMLCAPSPHLLFIGLRDRGSPTRSRLSIPDQDAVKGSELAVGPIRLRSILTCSASSSPCYTYVRDAVRPGLHVEPSRTSIAQVRHEYAHGEQVVVRSHTCRLHGVAEEMTGRTSLQYKRSQRRHRQQCCEAHKLFDETHKPESLVITPHHHEKFMEGIDLSDTTLNFIMNLKIHF
jgi:hypothetical protein